jgi:hypothetical protein
MRLFPMCQTLKPAAHSQAWRVHGGKASQTTDHCSLGLKSVTLGTESNNLGPWEMTTSCHLLNLECSGHFPWSSLCILSDLSESSLRKPRLRNLVGAM